MRRTTLSPHRKRSWIRSPILAVFLVLIIGWGIVVVIKIGIKYREAVQLRNEYRAELQQLQTKEGELNEKIKNLSTDRGLEAEVRNRYRVVRPGEQLVIVIDDQGASSTTTAQDTGSFWQKIREFIGF